MLVGKRHVTCGTIYHPPHQHSTKKKLFLEKLKNLLNLPNKKNKKIIYLLDDFNYDLLNPNKYAEIYIDSLYTMGYFLGIRHKTPKNKIQNEQNPEMDKIPNGQNHKLGKIPKWTTSQMKKSQTDKISNWTKSRMDKILNWTKSQNGQNPE